MLEVSMIEILLGGKSAKAILFYLYAFDEGYATEISEFSEMALNVIQKKLIRFEDSGLLVSKRRGKTKIFFWNPRYRFLVEFKNFIKKDFLSLSDEEMQSYYAKRQRPRKGDKRL